MDKKPNEFLLSKYTHHRCTKKEREEVESWYLDTAKHNQIDYDQIDLVSTGKRMEQHIAWHIRQKRTKKRYRWVAAASLAFLISVSGILFMVYNSSEYRQQTLANSQIIIPGSNKATLEIIGDQTITLDSSKTGIIIKDGSIQYSDGTNLIQADAPSEIQWARIRVPRGGKYELTLQDGSKVWLNSESELKYPLTFAPESREVYLEGEGYFDIAHQVDKNGVKIPFRVLSEQQQVEVLGTSFNISAYRDEVTYTTLVEGLVQITAKESSKTRNLSPNEQASVTPQGITIAQVDPESAISWKNGYFLFEDEKLAHIAKKIARWYDVEIVLKGVSGERRIWGSVSKYEDVSTLMETLSWTGAFQYKIEGRRIIIMK